MKEPSRWQLALFLLVLSCVNASAQQPEIKFDHLSLKEGLSQSTVLSIVQDRYGYMWFGTGDGLNKFDGYQFTVYRHNPQDPNSLGNPWVNFIYEDREGTLWIGTRGGGLNRLDEKSRAFIVYRNNGDDPYAISNNYVNAICQDSAGLLWVGTNGGLNRFDPVNNRFTTFRHDDKDAASLSDDTVKALCFDSRGQLWVGTNRGLNRFDPATQSFTRFHTAAPPPYRINNNLINVIYQDQTGRIWIGTEGGGVSRYDSGSFRQIPETVPTVPAISNSIVRSICQDRTGRIWIAMDGAGIGVYDPERGTRTFYGYNARQPMGLRTNAIFALHLDRAGAIWIGTGGAGINRFDPSAQRFALYRSDPDSSNSLSINYIRSIYQDRADNLWIGTDGGGLNLYNPQRGTFKIYRNDPRNRNSLSSNNVNAIYEDADGIIWIGTVDGGLNWLDPRTDTFREFFNESKPSARPNGNSVNVSPSLGEKTVNVIYGDRQGTIWIGFDNGSLYQFDVKSRLFIDTGQDGEFAAKLRGSSITSIVEDDTGAIWIGTYGGGLKRYDRARHSITTFLHDGERPSTLASNYIWTLCLDSTGTLWVGTYGGGLCRYNRADGTFSAYTERDGLPNNVIYAVLEDRQGYLWLSTNKGVARFDARTGRSRNYDVSDGLQSNEFNHFAFHKNNRGEIFLGGIDGLNSFHPEQVTDNQYIPPVVITAFKVLNDAAGERRFALGDTIELNYQQNYFSFEFAALNYTSPEKNLYAYRLEGVDHDWVYCGTRRYASYTTLAAGEYIFRVKGTNNDGIWNEQGTAIKIIIHPPLWKTTWAYGFYLFAFIAITYGGHKYRIKAVEHRNRLLEESVRERTTELAEAIEQLKASQREAEDKNRELARKNTELVELHQRADRIFSALADALPGTVLDGKYQLDEKIGTGGFGAVFRATHIALKRPVAVKIFKPSPGNDSVEGFERFQLEPILTCRVNHPNAVSVLDFGISTDGIAYLVMELLEGRTLKRELREKKVLTLHRAAEIILPVCAVLANAHKAGIVHRDIKPENIFLHQDINGEVVKVVDFGIAKLLEVRTSLKVKNLTGDGYLMGTPLYMAPERFLRKQYDGRADVYSMGVMLYEMLSGEVPFLEDNGMQPMIVQHLSQPPVSLKARGVDVPAAIDELIMRALIKEPEQRPTAREFFDDFYKALSQETHLSASELMVKIHDLMDDPLERATQAISTQGRITTESQSQ